VPYWCAQCRKARRRRREIPVFSTLTIEREPGDDAPKLTFTDRIGVSGDAWLESQPIQHGHTLILDDHCRLQVRMRESGRSSTTFPFRASPCDASEFQAG
jgi:hypothetical protein